VRQQLADYHRVCDRWPEAKQLYREIHEARRRVLGATHPDTLTTLHNLGVGHHAAGDLDEAIAALEIVGPGRKERLVARHPDTLTAAYSLGRAYQDAGHLVEAAELLCEAYAGRRSTLELEHPDTEMARTAALAALEELHDHGVDAQEAGDVERAVASFEAAWRGLCQVLGSDHADSVHTGHWLASALHHAGELVKSREVYEEILPHQFRDMGEGDPDTHLMHENYAAVLRDLHQDPPPDDAED
jgi:tetratricopeptide (TPR) repeat protein